MSKKMYGILGVMAIVIVSFIALQIYLHIDTKNFRNEIDASQKVKTETAKTPNVVFSDEKPEDVPGFEWVRHDDHWYKVAIDTPDTREVQTQEIVVQQEHPTPLTPAEKEKFWVHNGHPITAFTAEGWSIPEGTLPSEIDLEGANTLRKNLFTGLTTSEVHRYDTSKLTQEQMQLLPQARHAELYHRNPEVFIELREAYERLNDLRILKPSLYGKQ